MTVNLAAVKAFAAAHKTQLLAGGGAAAVGTALIVRKKNAGSSSAAGSATDPNATVDTNPPPTAAGYDGSGYGTDPSTLLAMVLAQQSAGQAALQGEIQTLEKRDASILSRLGKLREPHRPSPRPPHVIHGTFHPPGIWPHPKPEPPKRRRRRRAPVRRAAPGARARAR